jgi:hypothetical protein
MKRDWSYARSKVEAEGVCRFCGSPGPLDPAHVVPRSAGGDMDARAIVPLCRARCHPAYDGGRLELLPVLTRAEEIHAVELVGLGAAYARTTVRARGSASDAIRDVEAGITS